MRKCNIVWPQVTGHPLFTSLAIPVAIFALEKLIELCKSMYQSRAKQHNDLEDIEVFLSGGTSK